MERDASQGEPEPLNRPLADYAIIGDTRSTALVSSDGSIDWLCWPRHDSPAVLTRLLDSSGGGFASVHLDNGRSTGRTYVPDTNILRTTFESDKGAVMVTDLMPVCPPATAAEEGPDADAPGRVLRIVTCEAGEVRGMLRLRLTPDYGRSAAVPTAFGAHGVTLAGGGIAVAVRGSHSIVSEADTLRMSFHLQKGEQACLSFGLAPDMDGEDAPAAPADPLVDAVEQLERTRAFWLRWTAGMTYRGNYRDAVTRSALILKLLTYAPTGAIVAASTTSLPEAVPGNRNFDYRYSWVRDASFTVTAFCNLGLKREAAEYLRFLRGADGSGGRELQLLYAIDGPVPDERPLPHLPGWRNVAPVRIGNAARGQRQYDIHGEFAIALHAFLEAVDYQPPYAIADGLHDTIRALADHAARNRDARDHGIWELRTAPQHLQHSKALMWAALDRAARIGERLGGFGPEELASWRRTADALRANYEREAWNEERGAWMQGYGSGVLDAAVLRTVLFDALDPADPRLARTLAAIDRELVDGDLVYRYRMDDGFDGQEGAFTACAFWRAGVLAMMGRTACATALFGRLLARANDVGIFAEQIDAATGEQRGNLPQAFTHMCVINHAIRIERCVARFGTVDRE